MGCQTFNTTIGDNEYSYTQLSATKSLKLQFQLAKIIGGALGEIMPAMGKDKTKETQMKAFGNAMQKTFKENDPDYVANMIVKIFVPAFIGEGEDATRLKMDEHFTGNMGEMYEVLFWILGCEFGDFIKGFMDEEETVSL